MKNLLHFIFRKRERGQSLVEVALFFPIFIILVAGVIEVSHIAITKNRVANAARVGTRFGANGGEDSGISLVALNSVTQTNELEEELWDIWVIRGTVNGEGTGFVDGTWKFNHVYGISNTERFSDVNEANIQQQVLDELNAEGNAADLRIVGTYILHDIESILGLDAIPDLVGFNSVSGFNVMRVLGIDHEQTNGCDAFPIAVHEGVRSVTPPGQGADPFPQPNEFDYPPENPGPGDPIQPTYESFIYHEPNIPLEDAREGYVYKVQNGFGEGNFGWLLWNEGRPGSAGSLSGSLSFPGDSTDYADHGDNQIYPAADAYNHIVRGYVEPGDSTDTSLNIGDWVAANTGSVNANQVRDALIDHVKAAMNNRAIRLIVWDDSQQQGNNGRYRIKGFAIFKIHGIHLSQGQGGSWILAEFIRWDESCGQSVGTP